MALDVADEKPQGQRQLLLALRTSLGISRKLAVNTPHRAGACLL
jgi:hypothetical protein